MTVSDFPPVAPPQEHYGHVVWDDENGETYYLAGHVPARRAIAAANRYCRVECGLVNLADDKDAPLSWVTVRHCWWKPDPDDPDSEYALPAHEGDEGAQPYTEVSV